MSYYELRDFYVFGGCQSVVVILCEALITLTLARGSPFKLAHVDLDRFLVFWPDKVSQAYFAHFQPLCILRQIPRNEAVSFSATISWFLTVSNTHSFTLLFPTSELMYILSFYCQLMPVG